MPGERRSESWLRQVARAVSVGRWALVTGLVATLAPAIVLTMLHDHPYRAEATMVIRELPSDLTNQDAAVDPHRRLLNEIEVLEGDEVAERVRATLGIAGVVPPVHGFTNGSADVVVARVDSKIGGLAAELANAYVESYIAVQADRLSVGLRTAINDLEAQLDSLQQQISALPSNDPQVAGLLTEQSKDNATLDQMKVDLAVAEKPAEVVEPAAVPSDPLKPSLLRPILWSILVGLILGAIGVVMMSRGRKEVRVSADLSGLRSTEPVLAVLPNEGAANPIPIVVRQPSGRFADAYIPLRAALMKSARDRNVRVVQFCSPNDGDGTTTTAVNVALMLARTNLMRVAIVDLDMRSPRVHTMMNLEQAPGVTDALDEDSEVTYSNALDRLERMGRVGIGVGDELAALDSLGGMGFVMDETDIRPLSIPNAVVDKDLTVITSGTRPRSALEVLSRRRMDDLFDDLRSSFDMVIVDSPAALSSGDAAIIGRHADAIVMVVKSGTVTMSEVRQSLGAVERSGRASWASC